MSSLITRFGADTSGMQKGLDTAQARVRKFSSSVRSNLLRAFAVGAIIAQLRSLSQELDRIDKLAKQFGRNGEMLDFVQDLSHQAEKSGTSIETMAQHLRRFMGEINAASGPSKKIADEMDAIGLSLDELRGLNAEQLFAVIAESVGGLSDDVSQLASIQNLLGRSAGELLPLIKDVYETGGLAAAPRHTKQAIDATVSFNDSMSKLGTQLKTFVSPVLVLVSSLVSIFMTALENLGHQAGNIIVGLIRSFSNLSDAVKAAFRFDKSGIQAAFDAQRHTLKDMFRDIADDSEKARNSVIADAKAIANAFGGNFDLGTSGGDEGPNAPRERTGQRNDPEEDEAERRKKAAKLEEIEFEIRMTELADQRVELEERRARILGELAGITDDEVAAAEKRLELAKAESRIRQMDQAEANTARQEEERRLDEKRREEEGVLGALKRIQDAFNDPRNMGVSSLQSVGGGGAVNMPNQDAMLKVQNRQLERLNEIRDAIREAEGGMIQ